MFATDLTLFCINLFIVPQNYSRPEVEMLLLLDYGMVLWLLSLMVLESGLLFPVAFGIISR